MNSNIPSFRDTNFMDTPPRYAPQHHSLLPFTASEALWLFMIGISALFILISYSETTKDLEEPDAYEGWGGDYG